MRIELPINKWFVIILVLVTFLIDISKSVREATGRRKHLFFISSASHRNKEKIVDYSAGSSQIVEKQGVESLDWRRDSLIALRPTSPWPFSSERAYFKQVAVSSNPVTYLGANTEI